MKVFNAWNLTIKEQTDNTLKLRFYDGGSQGDERDFVRKIRAGQLDGAALTTTGLGILVRQVLVLSAPGVIEDYEQLDSVRAELGGRFEKMFDAEGYTLLGWGDVGKTRLFSMEKIERPSDIKKLRPWAWKDDLIFPEFLKVVGANPVRLGVPEVYAALQTRMVDTLARVRTRCGRAPVVHAPEVHVEAQQRDHRGRDDHSNGQVRGTHRRPAKRPGQHRDSCAQGAQQVHPSR